MQQNFCRRVYWKGQCRVGVVEGGLGYGWFEVSASISFKRSTRRFEMTRVVAVPLTSYMYPLLEKGYARIDAVFHSANYDIDFIAGASEDFRLKCHWS